MDDLRLAAQLNAHRRLGRSAAARRGGALAGALVVVLVLGGLVTGLLQMGLSFNRESSQRLSHEGCLELAEAGLAEGVVALRAGGSGAVADEATPARLGGGLLWVTVQNLGNDVERLVSSAMLGGSRRSLEALVFHYSEDGFDAAVFAYESLTLEANTFVDSYDPAGGPYATQLALLGTGHVSDGAVLQSNGDVQVESAAEVHGDVHPGRDGTLVTASSAHVSGITEPMPEDRALDPVVTPAIPVTGPLHVSGALTLPPGDYGFTELEVGTTAALVVTGPARVVMTDWTLRSNSSVVLDASGGPIELYVARDLNMASNSSVVTPSASAEDVQLHLTGDATQVAQFRSNGEFHGTIYAPEATVEIRSNFEVFGAVAARAVVLNSNVRIHYDESLHHDPDQQQYLVGSWSPVAFPRADWVARRIDPFVLLGLDRAALPSPADAHQP